MNQELLKESDDILVHTIHYLKPIDAYKLCKSSPAFVDYFLRHPIDLQIEKILSDPEGVNFFLHDEGQSRESKVARLEPSSSSTSSPAESEATQILKNMAVFKPAPAVRSLVFRCRDTRLSTAFWLALTRLIYAHRRTLKTVSVIYVITYDQADCDEMLYTLEGEQFPLQTFGGGDYPLVETITWCVPIQRSLSLWVDGSSFPKLRCATLTCMEWARLSGSGSKSGVVRQLLNIEEKQVIAEDFFELIALEGNYPSFLQEQDKTISSIIVLHITSMLELVAIGCRLVAEAQSSTESPLNFLLTQTKEGRKRNIHLQSLAFPCSSLTPQEYQLLNAWQFLNDPESRISVYVGQHSKISSGLCLTQHMLSRIIGNMLTPAVEDYSGTQNHSAQHKLALRRMMDSIEMALHACSSYDRHGYLIPPSTINIQPRFGLMPWAEEVSGLPFRLTPPALPDETLLIDRTQLVSSNAFTCKNCGNNRLFCHVNQEAVYQSTLTGRRFNRSTGKRLASLEGDESNASSIWNRIND